MQQSRTENIKKNVIAVLLTQIVTMLFAFVTRTIFIRLLGDEYLGLDGLFTSILTIFSLAELGIGHALVFSLYKPIAEGDTFKSQQLLTLYDKLYRWIIFAVLVIGIALLPFLEKIVNADVESLGINIYIVYILFLLNTVSSYFLAYRQSILIVNQLQRTVSLYQTIIKLFVYIVETLVLCVYHSYYLFLIIRVVGNYASSILISIKAKTLFPKLCVKNYKPLAKEEISKIKKNVYALFIRRVGGIILTTTDSIIINAYISLAMVGVYSNYVLIITSVQTITTQIMSAMTATIGNFIATQSKQDVKDAFSLYTFITYLVFGFCSVCFILLINPFISLLWGSEYLLSRAAVYLIVLIFFFYGFQAAINVFRDTTGLFTQGKYRSLYSASINVISSVILVQYLGIEGVLLGTIISRVFVSAWYDPYILHKCFFNTSSILYFRRLAIYIMSSFFIAWCLECCCSYIYLSWGGFCVRAIVALLSGTLLVLPFTRTAEFVDLKNRVLIMLKIKS